MLLKDLQKLGFSKNVSNVYLTLFELGQARAGEIIKKVGIHRNLVYQALDKLEQKKLIAKTNTRGVATYKTLDPARLMNELREKEVLLHGIIEELETIQKPKSQEIVVREGIEELRKFELNIYNNMEKGETLYHLGLATNWHDTIGKKTYEKLIEIQNEKQFFIRAIGGYIQNEEEIYQTKTHGLTEFKIIPAITTRKNEITIFRDSIFIKLFVEPYTIVEIKNAEIAESYKKYFNLLWEENSRTLRGEEGARLFLEDTLKYNHVYFIGGNGGMETYYPNVWNWYKKERLEKNVFWHDLIDPGMTLSGSKDATTIFDEPLYEWKFLPEAVASPHVICVYGNKVANIIWKEDSVINIIEDDGVAEGYKRYHKYLWNQEVTTYTGWEEITHLLNEVVLEELQEGDYECVIGAGYGTEETLDNVDSIFRVHNKKIIDKKLQKNILLYQKYGSFFEDQVKKLGDPSFNNIHIKHLPDTNATPVETLIYKHKAIITYFGENPVATVYERPEIVAGFKARFDLLWNQETQTYTGWEEIEQLFFNQILPAQSAGDTEYNLGAGYGESGEDERVRDFYLRYNTERTKRNINKQLLFSERHRKASREEFVNAGDPNFEHVKLKYLPDDYYSAMQTHIGAGKVIIVMWGDNPVATVYGSPTIVESFKKQFDLMWGIAKE